MGMIWVVRFVADVLGDGPHEVRSIPQHRNNSSALGLRAKQIPQNSGVDRIAASITMSGEPALRRRPAGAGRRGSGAQRAHNVTRANQPTFSAVISELGAMMEMFFKELR